MGETSTETDNQLLEEERRWKKVGKVIGCKLGAFGDDDATFIQPDGETVEITEYVADNIMKSRKDIVYERSMIEILMDVGEFGEDQYNDAFYEVYERLKRLEEAS